MAENYVCDGAIIECQLCTKPEGKLKVTSNEIKLQDKLFANTKDKEKVNLIFEGNCKKSSFQASPCQAVIATEDWKSIGDLIVQDSPALLANSTIMCTYGSVEIKITDELQQSVLTELTPSDTDSIAPDVQPKMLIQSATIIPEKKTQTTLKRKIRNADEEQENCYAIETIEILDLDEGSDNKGNGGTQEGMIYGKEYKLKVKKYFDNKKPKDLETINWGFTYDPEDGSVVVRAFKEKGEEVTFKTDDLDLCGKEVTFYAYIEDKEEEASLDVFHHYRFRWFDRKKVLEQAQNRKNTSWKVDQGGSSLCGMASLFYLLSQKDPDGYLKIVKELHKTGETIYNQYTIEPHPKAMEMYDMDPGSSDYNTVSMPYVDWIVLATTRSKESLNSAFVYKGVETGNIDMLKAVNWPRMMMRMTKDLVGYTNVDMTGLNEFLIQQKKRPLGGKLYDKYSNSDLEHLKDMESKFKNGKQIIMMIDADMISDGVSYSYSDITNDSHWVVYEGKLKLLDKNKSNTTDLDKVEYVGFDIFTWGYNPINGRDENGFKSPKTLLKNKSISVKSFKSNFYGYIEAS